MSYQLQVLKEVGRWHEMTLNFTKISFYTCISGDEEDGNYLEELQFDSPELKPGLLQPFNGPELDSGSIFE